MSRGLDVIILDKAAFPRDKCCGDGLTTDALRILDELGLRPESITNWNAVTARSFTLPKGKEQFSLYRKEKVSSQL